VNVIYKFPSCLTERNPFPLRYELLNVVCQIIAVYQVNQARLICTHCVHLCWYTWCTCVYICVGTRGVRLCTFVLVHVVHVCVHLCWYTWCTFVYICVGTRGARVCTFVLVHVVYVCVHLC
jgi:hypothetical protein